VTALDLAERELDLPVGAAILNGVYGAALVAVKRDGSIPEQDLHCVAAFESTVIFHGVPVVGMKARGTRFLAAIMGIAERGWWSW
jgi:hypothetical protein